MTMVVDVATVHPTGVADPGSTAAATWKPGWTVDVGHGCSVGVAKDDGCYVVLYPDGDGWRPGVHIPPAAAKLIGELAS